MVNKKNKLILTLIRKIQSWNYYQTINSMGCIVMTTLTCYGISVKHRVYYKLKALVIKKTEALSKTYTDLLQISQGEEDGHRGFPSQVYGHTFHQEKL